MKNTKWPGNWKVACHVCGMWYPSSEITKRWDGLLVCKKDYETRHPQTLTKARSRAAVPPFINKEPEDWFTTGVGSNWLDMDGNGNGAPLPDTPPITGPGIVDGELDAPFTSDDPYWNEVIVAFGEQVTGGSYQTFGGANIGGDGPGGQALLEDWNLETAHVVDFSQTNNNLPVYDPTNGYTMSLTDTVWGGSNHYQNGNALKLQKNTGWPLLFATDKWTLELEFKLNLDQLSGAHAFYPPALVSYATSNNNDLAGLGPNGLYMTGYPLDRLFDAEQWSGGIGVYSNGFGTRQMYVEYLWSPNAYETAFTGNTIAIGSPPTGEWVKLTLSYNYGTLKVKMGSSGVVTASASNFPVNLAAVHTNTPFVFGMFDGNIKNFRYTKDRARL